MTTKGKGRKRRSCKLKRPVRTKKGRKRTCKKRKSRGRNKKIRKNTFKMKRKPKLGLLLTPNKKETEERFAYRMVIDGLKHMNLQDVKKIYDGVVSVKPDKIYEYYNEDCKRLVIEVNDGEIKFYKSTGESRLTGLKGIWLPFDDCVFDLKKYFLAKPEDKFIIDFQLKGMKSELLKDNFNNLNTYKRFINERTASISKWLYENK